MQRSVASSGPTAWSAPSNCLSQTPKTLKSPVPLDGRDLSSARLLLVEDDFIILLELETILSDAGAQIVGSCRTVAAALTLANDGAIDAALLDSRVGHETITPVARTLARRDMPFAFYTAQSSSDSSLSEWPKNVILGKPASPNAILATVANLLRRG